MNECNRRTVEHVATVKTVTLERISKRISEQIVDAPVPLARSVPLFLLLP